MIEGIGKMVKELLVCLLFLMKNTHCMEVPASLASSERGFTSFPLYMYLYGSHTELNQGVVDAVQTTLPQVLKKYNDMNPRPDYINLCIPLLFTEALLSDNVQGSKLLKTVFLKYDSLNARTDALNYYAALSLSEEVFLKDLLNAGRCKTFKN